MGFLSWVVVGLLAGGLGRMLSGSEKRGCLPTMGIGLLGALIGGALANAAWGEGIGEFGLRSVVVASLGATLLLLVLRALGAASTPRSRRSR